MSGAETESIMAVKGSNRLQREAQFPLGRGSAAAALLTFACNALLFAQYPGRLPETKTAVAGLRSVAVLEWTGEAGKPNASRLVPVTVFDGEQLQDGGLYLARPEPLSLDSGTEYELEKGGMPAGWFDVYSAGQLSGDWFGFGAWRSLVPVEHKLKPAKVLPQVVGDGRAGDNQPHFKQHGSSGGSTPPAAAPQKPPATQTTTASAPPPEPVDPERPTLRRRPSPDSNAPKISTNTIGSETPTNAPDPDRPHLTHGKPTDAEAAAPKQLETTPAGLQQLVAVSDASEREPQNFAYSWTDPAQAAQLQHSMELLARKALAAKSTSTQHALNPGAMNPRAIPQPASPERAAAARDARNRRSRKAAAVTLPALQDVFFRSFALTYGGGATLVLTATEGGGDAERYVTVVAQPDIYGVVHLLFTSVTDSSHLRDTPRMRLVDAVDAEGNRRGDLLFELRGQDDRRFALYRVAQGQVDQIFVGDPMPFHLQPAVNPDATSAPGGD